MKLNGGNFIIALAVLAITGWLTYVKTLPPEAFTAIAGGIVGVYFGEARGIRKRNNYL